MNCNLCEYYMAEKKHCKRYPSIVTKEPHDECGEYKRRVNEQETRLSEAASAGNTGSPGEHISPDKDDGCVTGFGLDRGQSGDDEYRERHKKTRGRPKAGRF